MFWIINSFDEQSGGYIVEAYEDYQPSLPEKVFPFGIDPAGNLICYDYSSSETNPFVVFWGIMKGHGRRKI
ncbi:hypothetical protein A374_18975 [Fictibacillus macauensis ZFHKF-1]|uniref:Knr4/Smi1-like domain-containing protein n=1 Tax=Fictibacillus macauensis ZFHKF-1 TaxID=1196324 RepID=I8UA98_9BACL|nr:hypothetical protein A374_18975 [Fictibacillus macauensis ZFHKF-1]